MSARYMFAGIAVTVALVAPGCAVETTNEWLDGEMLSVPLDPMGGPSDPEDEPPGSQNGFLPACFWAPHVIPAYRRYAMTRLWNSPAGSTFGTLPSNAEMDFVSTACRAEALKYLARCALPKDTSFIDPLDGRHYWGWLNLAPSWRSGPLSSDDQWWITSCLTQHLNGFHEEVPLLFDGLKSTLYPTGAAHAQFVKRDSRTWGNLFTSTGYFVLNVCYESNLISECSENSVVDTRLCDTDPSIGCNLNIVGACSVACTWSGIMGAYSCGSAGYKNIGSRLRDFSTYDTLCRH